MNLCIDSHAATIQCGVESLDAIIDRLERAGYDPLVRKAAQSFSAVWGGTTEDLLNGSEDEDDLANELEATRRRIASLERIGYSWSPDGVRGLSRLAELKGELFFSDDASALLFVTMIDTTQRRSPEDAKGEPSCRIRAGFIGDAKEHTGLQELIKQVSSALDEMSISCTWEPDDITNKTFIELTQAKPSNLQLASNVSERDIRAAKSLENANVREVASMVRRSGVMLAKELLKAKPDQASEIIRWVDQLLQVELLRQEYVVLCSKSGAHVNRVESRDIIEQMAQLGVLCSCGRPIAEEQVEGLLASDALLPKMLESDYWLTATVVRFLNALNVPSTHILVGSVDSNDVQVFADVDGALLMFDLRDTEFGLPDAYTLGCKIALYRPQLAFIVSTRGVAPEVKEHFKKVKPETQLMYVANLTQLESTTKKVVEGIRSARVKSWLACFQELVNFPLHAVVLPKLIAGPKVEMPHVVTSVQIQPETDQSLSPQGAAR